MRALGRHCDVYGSRTYRADELDLDTSMLEPLPILWTNSDSALDRLAIHKERGLLATVLVELDIDHRTLICIVEDNVDIDGSREEVRHDGRVVYVRCLLPLVLC
jgi:hypothetical protein